ncbi:MAG TPA: hypothetical protein VJZ71_16530 [Phycisphaerae bacterium]|nr:hypothetical protein [Phycisphaerae bacterium]
MEAWKLCADGSDNHWLDCLVGCAVVAPIQARSYSAPMQGLLRARESSCLLCRGFGDDSTPSQA